MTDVTKVGLFDLDDSLVDRAGTYARWATEFSRERGVPLGWPLETDPMYSSRRVAFFELMKDTFNMSGTVDELHAEYRRRMRIFRHALAALDAEPSPRAVMVGDSLTADVGGALAAGLSAVWGSHSRPPPAGGPWPHRTVVTICDALELLLKESCP
ncbi:HAD family hydrolase [Streptomyces sp. UNOB3_S3]|uniref:HAD family hydrolase n=1 Tax=Streptomyces sp. UNOB3_S3 TaxID=2871682 RepID=UPI001E51E9F3|nr:HAD family hydrolase [Streptomyces sp. UNOB3_S3]MCC3773340.1 HAD family hydrolase [Streptomyces sp. UNOB3_S3]